MEEILQNCPILMYMLVYLLDPLILDHRWPNSPSHIFISTIVPHLVVLYGSYGTLNNDVSIFQSSFL